MGRGTDGGGGTSTAALIVSDVVKTFGDVEALAGVSFHVDEGEIVTLLGENGAGKSTLMRILSTIVVPDSGTATVGGADVVNDARQVRGRVGLALADERSLYWRLSGSQNLQYFGSLYGLRRKAAAEKADALIDRVGLGEVAERAVGTYSTGMRARLIIARALVGSPEVLLFDEPTRSLDPIASVAIRDLVQELCGEQGLAALYATHDLHEAAEIGSRSLIISRGRIVASAASGVAPASLEKMLLEART